MKDTIYEEIGRNYRFFARWRHLAFLANFAVLAGVVTISLTAFEKAHKIAWWIPLWACPIPILLWMMDVRTYRITCYAIKAGKELEKDNPGFFTAHHMEDEKRGKTIFRHSLAAFLFLWGTSAFFLAFAYILRK